MNDHRYRERAKKAYLIGGGSTARMAEIKAAKKPALLAVGAE